MDYVIRIRDLREEKGKNQTEIALLLHVAQTTYSDYELDKVRIPYNYLIELAQFYDVDMNYICGLTNERKRFPKNKKENKQI